MEVVQLKDVGWTHWTITDTLIASFMEFTRSKRLVLPIKLYLPYVEFTRFGTTTKYTLGNKDAPTWCMRSCELILLPSEIHHVSFEDVTPDISASIVIPDTLLSTWTSSNEKRFRFRLDENEQTPFSVGHDELPMDIIRDYAAIVGGGFNKFQLCPCMVEFVLAVSEVTIEQEDE